MTDEIKKTDVAPNNSAPGEKADEGSTVKVHYTGTLDSGETFDSSAGKEPIEFTVGEKQVIPGFEDAVRGMKVGEKKTVTLEKDAAYGESDPSLVQKVPKEAFGEVTPEVGMQLALQHPQAPQPIPVRVVKVEGDGVTIDMNHPLAGQKLNFELELVEVN